MAKLWVLPSYPTPMSQDLFICKGKWPSATFVENSSVFQKKCVAYYTNIRLQDAVKKIHLEDNEVNTISPKKTCWSLSTTAEAGKCFFCDESDAEI